jgi:hypothetical protein
VYPPKATPSKFRDPAPCEKLGSDTQKFKIELALETDSIRKIGGKDNAPEIALMGKSLETKILTVTLSPTSKVPLVGLRESVAASALNGKSIKSDRNKINL